MITCLLIGSDHEIPTNRAEKLSELIRRRKMVKSDKKVPGLELSEWRRGLAGRRRGAGEAGGRRGGGRRGGGGGGGGWGGGRRWAGEAVGGRAGGRRRWAGEAVGWRGGGLAAAWSAGELVDGGL